MAELLAQDYDLYADNSVAALNLSQVSQRGRAIVTPFRAELLDSNVVEESGQRSSQVAVTFLGDAGSHPVHLHLRINDRTEGRVSSRTLSFGRRGETKTVTITGVNDYLADGSVKFYLEFVKSVSNHSPFNSSDSISVRLPDPIEFINLDDDPGVVVTPFGKRIEADNRPIKIGAQLSMRSRHPVTASIIPAGDFSRCEATLCGRLRFGQDYLLAPDSQASLLVERKDDTTAQTHLPTCAFFLELQSRDPKFNGVRKYVEARFLDDEVVLGASNSDIKDPSWSFSENDPDSLWPGIGFSFFSHTTGTWNEKVWNASPQKNNFENYLDISTLHVIIRSTASAVLTHDRIRQSIEGYEDGMAKLDHATKGTIRSRYKHVIVDTHFDISDFEFENCGDEPVILKECESPQIRFTSNAWNKIQSILGQHGISPLDFDSIQFDIPWDEWSGPPVEYGKRHSRGWAPGPPAVGESWNWSSSRITIYPQRRLYGGRTPPYSGSIVLHELGHILEYALDRVDDPELKRDKISNLHGDTYQIGGDYVVNNTTTFQRSIWKGNMWDVEKPSEASSLGNPERTWKLAGVGDIFGDGISDLIWRNGDTLRSWHVDVEQHITGGAELSVSAAGLELAGLGDFNYDGKDDLIFQRSSDGQVIFMALDGEQVIEQRAVGLPGNQGWRLLGVGNVSADGYSNQDDLIWQNESTRRLRSWIMRGTSVVGGSDFGPTPPASYKFIAVGKINADYNDDILWKDTTTGAYHAWLMGENGTLARTITLNRPEGASTNQEVVAIGQFSTSQHAPLWLSMFPDGSSTVPLGWTEKFDNALWSYYFYHQHMWTRLADAALHPVGTVVPNDRTLSIRTETSSSPSFSFLHRTSSQNTSRSPQPLSQICPLTTDVHSAPAVPLPMLAIVLPAFGLLRRRERANGPRIETLET